MPPQGVQKNLYCIITRCHHYNTLHLYLRHFILLSGYSPYNQSDIFQHGDPSVRSDPHQWN